MGKDPARETILCGPPAVTEIYTRNNRTSEDFNFLLFTDPHGGKQHLRTCTEADQGRGGGCGECIPLLAIFKHVFDEYKFFIISNFFENNRPYAPSTHNRKCANKMSPSYLVKPPIILGETLKNRDKKFNQNAPENC